MKNLLAFVSKTLGTRMVSRVDSRAIGTVVGFDKQSKGVLLKLELKEGATDGWLASMVADEDILLCDVHCDDRLRSVAWQHLINAPVDLYKKYGIQKGDIIYSRSADAVGRLVLIKDESSALLAFDHTLDCNHCTGWEMSKSKAEAYGIEYDENDKRRYWHINPETMYKI